MVTMAIIGFLLFTFSLLYLLFHFIRKIRNREALLSKKIFLPSLIIGLLMLIIGGTNMDTGLQTQLTEAQQTN